VISACNCDLHTHTTYSDGRSPLVDNVRAGEAAQLDAIAIADHLYPRELDHFSDRNLLKQRFREIEQVRKWASLRVIMAVEATATDTHGGISVNAEDLEDVELVLVDVGGITEGVASAAPEGRNPQLDAVFRLYTRLAEHPLVDVIAHPFNLGRFGLDVTLGDLPDQMLRDLGSHLADHGVAFEIISTFWWWWPQMHPQEVAEAYARVVALVADGGAYFTLSSDAHANCGVGNLGWARRVAGLAGLDNDQWADVEIGQRSVG